MWGIIPATGAGSRNQPLAFSKELLPVGSRLDGNTERPRAVCEYLVERMIAGGATKICFIISPGKSDILEYFGAGMDSVTFTYIVQPKPLGLCDALFRSETLINPDEHVLIGLPDTIWFPEEGMRVLPDDHLSFLLFPVEHPELFESVNFDSRGNIMKIHVKEENAASRWIWGAFKMPGHIFRTLAGLWRERSPRDEYIGNLVNAYIASGGKALGVPGGHFYVDVGTLHGYREAMKLLNRIAQPPASDSEEDEPNLQRVLRESVLTPGGE